MSGPNYHAWTHLPKAQGGTDPLELSSTVKVFRAIVNGGITAEDVITSRKHYESGGGVLTVDWDDWDPTFDTSIYSIEGYDFTDPLSGRPSIVGVQLLKRGLYSIHAQIDIHAYFNGVTLLQSNYDEGQFVYAEHNNIGDNYPTEPFLGDAYGIRLDHWRFVERDRDEDDPHDQILGGSSSDVEIGFAQNCNAEVVPYGGVVAGVSLTAGGTPSPGEDVWIPGGYEGAWGIVPKLIVAYWGVTDSDPEWPEILFAS